MNKILLIAAIVLILLVTFIAGIKKPELNKPVSFGSGQIKAQVQQIPAGDVHAQISTVSQPKAKINVTNVPEKIAERPIQVTQLNPPKQKTVKTQVPQVQTQTKKPEIRAVEKPVQTRHRPEQPKQRIMTEQEEIIAWNAWRSKIQNTVMQRFQTTAPIGAQFKFSFTVDKWGHISNLSVGCCNSICPSHATERIRTVIMGFQGTSILNFPAGTTRLMTPVKGGFEVSTGEDHYSKPSDFSDYERVRRKVGR